MSDRIDPSGSPGSPASRRPDGHHDHHDHHADREPVHELHPEECWEFLAGRELGRLAFHLTDEVHIVPINYAVDDERLVFLTAEGSKLLGLTMNADVAFEVDEVEGEHAISVIVRGRARQLVGSSAWVADRLPLRPWIGTPKHVVVEILADEVTGRCFELRRPWLKAKTDL